VEEDIWEGPIDAMEDLKLVYCNVQMTVLILIADLS
jgi:hypothetical protein